MRNIIYYAFLTVVLSNTISARAEVPEQCLENNIRNQCPESCTVACNDADFLSENTTFCLGRGIFAGSPSPSDLDAPECADLFATSRDGDGSGGAAPPPATPTDITECEELDSIFEQRRCILAIVSPECSASVPELQGRARLLVTEIEEELRPYGELLDRDWTDISNLELLCAFTVEGLEENYQIASQNPDSLRVLQRNAREIQNCQGEWEVWIRDYPAQANSVGISDELVDQMARASAAQLGALEDQMEGLSVSIDRLENAAVTIVSIIDLYIAGCDPNNPTVPEQ